jgi:hypothetical protein
MRATIVLILLGAISLAEAAPRKPPPPSRLSLVPAQCPGVPPGPCSPGFAFAAGTAVLVGARQPVPTCPGGKQASGGKVTLAKVTKNGVAFSGTLRATVTLRTTFTVDQHNANCDLSGIQIELPALSGDVTCQNGKCKGSLFGIGCVPPTCADTFLTTEYISLVVSDDAGQPLATPGTFVPAAADDVQQ